MESTHLPAAVQALLPDAPEYARLLAAAAVPVHDTLGEHIVLQPTTLDQAGPWGFLMATMQGPDGGRPDFTDTPLAERATHGHVSDLYVALLKQDAAGTWQVIDHALGPTDVSWLTWPQQHGVPPALLGLKPR